MNVIQDTRRAFCLIVACLAGFLVAGCENKETILDVEGPRGEIEVERDRDTDEIDIDVDRR